MVTRQDRSQHTPMGRARLRTRGRGAALAAALMLATPAAASAEPPPTQPVRFAASTESHVSTETSQVLPAWTPAVTMVNTYGQLLNTTRNANSWSLQSRATTHLLVAFGLFDWVELDLGIPMVIYQDGTTANTTLQSTLRATGIGDVRTGIKGTILRTPARGFGLGLSLDVTFPTGTRSALLGEAGATYAPQVLLEYRFAWGIEMAVNVGYYVRPDVTVGSVILADSLTLRGAVRLPFGPYKQGAVMMEADGAVGVLDGAQRPLILRAGPRWRFANGMLVGLYAGGAVIQAFGLPDIEGMLNVGWAPPGRLGREIPFKGSPTPSARRLARRHDRMLQRKAMQVPQRTATPDDLDADGILAANDRCPNVPEDLDNFEDADGCPELDNDRDSVRDVLDMCPNAPEVVNGWADWDGCPDRRIDAATGQSSTVFDPNVALPQVVFQGDEDVLNEDGLAQLDAFIALLQLNPWLGRLDLAIAVNVATVKDAEIALAARRKAHLDEQLAARGLSRRRYRFVRPRAVTKGVPQAVYFETADVATGLRPVGATDAEFTMVMEAAIKEELARRRAASADATPPESPAPAAAPASDGAPPIQSSDDSKSPSGGSDATTPPGGSPSAPPSTDASPEPPISAPTTPATPSPDTDVPKPTAPIFEPPVQRPRIPLPGPPG